MGSSRIRSQAGYKSILSRAVVTLYISLRTNYSHDASVLGCSVLHEDTRVYHHRRSPPFWDDDRNPGHEAVFALCPVLTILRQSSPAVLHRDTPKIRSCRQRHPQPHLPPSLASKSSSKLRLNHTKSRLRRTFSCIRSPPSYNLATQLLPY